jgi:molecular chaperone HscB
VHPDLFGYRTKREQDISTEASSRLNVAYKVILNPVTRAQYLLQLHGIDAIGEAAGSANVDGELLLQVMEAREQLDDSSTTVETAQRLQHNVVRSISVSITDLSMAFKKGDLKQAADITVALQYFTKLNSECEEWLAQHHQVAER